MRNPILIISQFKVIGNFLRKIKKFLYRNIPVRAYLKILYWVRFSSIIDIDDPKKFSEKIFCLKIINGRGDVGIYQKCYDKFTVREYIKEKLGEKQGEAILNELYGVYDSVDQIDFDALPNQFVIKVTQSSGYNVICPDKTKLNIEKAKSELKKWLSESNEPQSDEEEYESTGNAKLVCEKFLQEKDGSIPSDVRVYCFNGKAKLFVIDFGTTEPNGKHSEHVIRNVYDLDWQLLDVDLGRPHDPAYVMKKPDNLTDIIKVAEKLAEDFFFVRVDLYNIDGKEIKFGELTWIPMGGSCVINPVEYDYILGEWLTIPKF